MTRLLVIAVALAACALAATAGTANAQQVTHFKDAFTYDVPLAAGTFCDVPIENYGHVNENVTLFGDPNSPTRGINEQVQFNFWKNVKTGLTLTDNDHFTSHFNTLTQTFTDN